MTTEDRLLNMATAAKLLGVPTKRLRRTLVAAHDQKGNVLVRVRHLYFVTESALRTLFPQIFSNTRSTIDERISTLEHEIETLNRTLTETRKSLYQARTRIRVLEERMKPGKAQND